LGARARDAYILQHGAAHWAAHQQAITDFWREIAHVIRHLEPHYAQVRLYQDGLPVCGNELQIVQDVAAQGSKNYQLLQELITAGARLMGTEDPELLLQE
jgi:hypothetical protein